MQTHHSNSHSRAGYGHAVKSSSASSPEGGDDYGLRRIELVAYRVTSFFGDRMEPVSQGFDVGGQRAILARPLLDLRGWGLMPGDTVRYYARAVDNSPASQVSISEEYLLRMPDAADLRRGS